MIGMMTAAALAAATVLHAPGPVVESKSTLTLEGARLALEAAGAYAREHGAGGSIAVVDDGGHLVAFDRLDGTFPGGVEVAIGKARTAATFRKSTTAFEDTINKGRTAMLGVNFTPLQGGVPIIIGGRVVGAVGVSGAKSAPQDEEVASAGAAAVAQAAGDGAQSR